MGIAIGLKNSAQDFIGEISSQPNELYHYDIEDMRSLNLLRAKIRRNICRSSQRSKKGVALFEKEHELPERCNVCSSEMDSKTLQKLFPEPELKGEKGALGPV